ncbi:MAG: hypothetical protein KN64_02875 [Sulfurovum sp. AS07-7]|nr:MAG: hypothetical protein KN64_02875 [Sulfurovum sp. AS07-7]
MSEHFIKNIEIKNFKLFKDFKAEGFGKVNLIGGKNNVGKTAFMEAVYVNVHSESIEHLTYALYACTHNRNYLEYVNNKEPSVKKILDAIQFYESESNIKTVKFEVISINGKKKYKFFDDIEINKNEFSEDYKHADNIEFIDNFGFTNYELKLVYEAVQIKDKEEVLYEYINEFDKNILNFKIIGGDKPQCKKIKGDYQDLNEFGDGLKHYISIICSLYACVNGYLFIDEIDNGIHYTKLDELWEIILTVSKEQSVQVFATTHSKECIESYARVAKRLEDYDVKYIKLSKLKDGSIYAGVRDFDMLQYVIDDEHEVR